MRAGRRLGLAAPAAEGSDCWAYVCQPTPAQPLLLTGFLAGTTSWWPTTPCIAWAATAPPSSASGRDCAAATVSGMAALVGQAAAPSAGCPAPTWAARQPPTLWASVEPMR